ncbi:MAG TPA: hypothetical protein VL334_02560 [Anaerolineae bacterium]|nr:hypothetical protein [Anaerolineae bacterium]
MTGNLIYTERVSSSRTQLLFIALTVLFGVLAAWRVKAARASRLARVFLLFAAFFLFYVLNYRTLVIRLTPAALTLRFGLFTWTVPLENVAGCSHDELPTPMRLGGAGIHFMMVRQRYRVLFNFLEHPRVVVALKSKAGPVQDVSFSTRQPDQILPLIQAVIAPRKLKSSYQAA